MHHMHTIFQVSAKLNFNIGVYRIQYALAYAQQTCMDRMVKNLRLSIDESTASRGLDFIDSQQPASKLDFQRKQMFALHFISLFFLLLFSRFQ